MPRLTIAIPTYNRSKEIAETVGKLLPQLTPDCQLLIVDNASDIPTSEVLSDLVAKVPELNVQFHRNRYNVGMCGNFMRCFELCETEWLWMLGDDDPPLPDAISKIFRHLELYPDCVFHNFACPTLRKENRLPPREKVTVTKGVEDFVYKLDHFSSIQFMSLSVYRAPCFLPHLAAGVHYAYSLQNYIALILLGLQGDRLASFSPEVLIPDHGSLNKAWSRIGLGLVGCSILDLPLPRGVRKCLGEKIIGTFFPLKSTATVLLDELRKKSKSPDEVRYLFYQICARNYGFEASLATRLEMAFYKLLLRFPGFSVQFMRLPLAQTMLFDPAYVRDPRTVKSILRQCCPPGLLKLRRKIKASYK